MFMARLLALALIIHPRQPLAPCFTVGNPPFSCVVVAVAVPHLQQGRVCELRSADHRREDGGRAAG